MTRVISLSDDAYDNLRMLKEENESFSEVIRRITKDRKAEKLMDLAGCSKGSDVIPILKGIYKDRKKAKLRSFG